MGKTTELWVASESLGPGEPLVSSVLIARLPLAML
jgi:hypothetical protein